MMKHRKALIAAATVVGVLVAGVAAVSANIGILDNGDNGPVGELSAAQVTTPAPRTVDTVTPTRSAEGQVFEVDDSGTVVLRSDGSGIRVGDVRPTDGWEWRSVQDGDHDLSVVFTSSTRTLQLVAQQHSDGTITARVEQSRSPSETAGSSPATPDGEHEHEDNEHEDNEHKDNERAEKEREQHEREQHEREQHERDRGERHEYEGHDDDD